jgi:hypothetical protein
MILFDSYTNDAIATVATADHMVYSVKAIYTTL